MSTTQDTPHPNSITAAAERRAEYIAGLRAIADFLEGRPDVPLPYDADLGRHYTDRAEFIAAVRAIGGEKRYSSDFMEVARSFGPHEVRFQCLRETVCERVVVGTEKVMVPDPDAPKVEKEREVVEWRCAPLLAEAA